MSSNPFEDYSAVQEYAQANDLEVASRAPTVFRVRQRKLAPEQFEVRPVLRTNKGPTHVGLFGEGVCARGVAREPGASGREARGVAATRWSAVSRSSRSGPRLLCGERPGRGREEYRLRVRGAVLARGGPCDTVRA